MNKIKFYFLIAFAAIVSVSSCKKTISLDEVGGIPVDSVIRTEADLNGLVKSGYFAFAADDYYGGAFQVYSELPADHLDGVTLGGNYLSAFSRSVNIFNGDNASLYGQISKPIYQANLVLDYIGLASAAGKNELMGQAKFMRALATFDLVRLYAQPYVAATAATTPGVPLRLNSERQKVVRKSVAEVYAQIIADLKSADTLLSLSNSVYATKWSARAALAKVYFQMNDFTNAYLYSNMVLANGGFGFDATITQRFSSGRSSETVFGLIPETANPRGRFGRLRDNFSTLGAGLPALRLDNAFYTRATANATDKRNAAWYTSRNGSYLLSKFDTAYTLPVLYTTELKLIRAEAAAESNTNLPVAIADMNQIITRAYGAASGLILPANATAALIKDAARRERELELVGEGNWLQELKRRGAKGEAITIRGAVYNCPGLIFPFPSNEIIYSAPGLIQNPTGGCN
ncbi:MAG: hypothetical protein JWQ27_1821 [Ferruginibacter sp.]|nr:hypothetical protein [Ferruginibacter sp.]